MFFFKIIKICHLCHNLSDVELKFYYNLKKKNLFKKMRIIEKVNKVFS